VTNIGKMGCKGGEETCIKKGERARGDYTEEIVELRMKQHIKACHKLGIKLSTCHK